MLRLRDSLASPGHVSREPVLSAAYHAHTYTLTLQNTHTHTHTHSHARATNGRARVVTLRVVPPSRGGYERHGQTAHSCGPSQGIGHARPTPRRAIMPRSCQTSMASAMWRSSCPTLPLQPWGYCLICCSLHSAHLLIGRRRTTVSGRHACCCGAPGGHPGLGINLCVWCSRPVRPPASYQAVRLSSALPPVSAKIAASGQYVPMKNLLPDNVSLCLQLALPGPHVVYSGLPKPRLREVQSPFTWVSCFLAYVAVLTPDPKTRDLLTYARLVVVQGGRSMTKNAALDPTVQWNELNPSPTVMTFRAEPASAVGSVTSRIMRYWHVHCWSCSPVIPQCRQCLLHVGLGLEPTSILSSSQGLTTRDPGDRGRCSFATSVIYVPPASKKGIGRETVKRRLVTHSTSQLSAG